MLSVLELISEGVVRAGGRKGGVQRERIGIGSRSKNNGK
jgi:hypothetical protein